MSAPPPLPETPKPKFEWYEHVWMGLPLALIAVGGAIGGACGGAAWAVNQQVFRKTENPVLKYVWTGLISLAAVVAYVVIASVVISLIRGKS